MLRTIYIAYLLTVLAFSIAAQQNKPEPVSVPDINGMAVTLAKPEFPETAVAVDGDGETTVVRVVVDENGIPVSAVCSLTCHGMLKEAAERAAMTSRFKPLIVGGKAVSYQGTLHFTFVVSRVNWFRFATALESTRQFDNLSLGPVAQMLSTDFADEKKNLLSLDADGIDFEKRQLVLTAVTSAIRLRLKGADLWRFDLALSLRKISFWTMAAARTDRASLQKAIDDLPNVIVAAPDETPEDLLANLKTLASYRVPADMKEAGLRKEIFDMTRKIAISFK